MKIKIADKITFEIILIIVAEFSLLGSKYLLGTNNAVLLLGLSLLIIRKTNTTLGLLEKVLLIWIIYLAVVTIVTFPTNYNKSNSAISIVEYLSIFLCCHVMGYGINVDTFIEYFRNISILWGVLAIIEGRVEAPFLANLFRQSTMQGSGGYRSVLIFNHPIVCGAFLMMGFISLVEYPFKKKWKQWGALLIMIVAIVSTQSRSAWIAFIIVLSLVLVKHFDIKLSNKRFKNFLASFGIIFGLALIDALNNFKIANLFISTISNRLDGSLDAGAGQGNIIRIDTVTNSFNYWFNGNISKFIFGMGKNFDKYFMVTHPVVKWGNAWTAAIDNQYVTTIHEAGIIGLSMMIIAIGVATYRVLKTDSTDRSAMFSNLSILTIAITNYFYEGLNYMSIVTMLLLLAVISDRVTDSNK